MSAGPLPTTNLKFIDIANAYNASGLGNVGTTNLKLSLFAGAVLTDGVIASSGPFNTSMFYGITFGSLQCSTTATIVQPYPGLTGQKWYQYPTNNNWATQNDQSESPAISIDICGNAWTAWRSNANAGDWDITNSSNLDLGFVISRISPTYDGYLTGTSAPNTRLLQARIRNDSPQTSAKTALWRNQIDIIAAGPSDNGSGTTDKFIYLAYGGNSSMAENDGIPCLRVASSKDDINNWTDTHYEHYGVSTGQVGYVQAAVGFLDPTSDLQEGQYLFITYRAAPGFLDTPSTYGGYDCSGIYLTMSNRNRHHTNANGETSPAGQLTQATQGSGDAVLNTQPVARISDPSMDTAHRANSISVFSVNGEYHLYVTYMSGPPKSMSYYADTTDWTNEWGTNYPTYHIKYRYFYGARSGSGGGGGSSLGGQVWSPSLANDGKSIHSYTVGQSDREYPHRSTHCIKIHSRTKDKVYILHSTKDASSTSKLMLSKTSNASDGASSNWSSNLIGDALDPQTQLPYNLQQDYHFSLTSNLGTQDPSHNNTTLYASYYAQNTSFFAWSYDDGDNWEHIFVPDEFDPRWNDMAWFPGGPYGAEERALVINGHRSDGDGGILLIDVKTCPPPPFDGRLGTVDWSTVESYLSNFNSDIGYTVYEMIESSSQVGTPNWYRLESTAGPITTSPFNTASGSVAYASLPYLQITGGLILVVDDNDKVIWKINTVGDNGLGGEMYAYNSGSTSALDLSVEYINYDSQDFPFQDISGYTASRPINGNSTGGATFSDDWHNNKTGNATKRVVDDFRNHLGLKWVFIHYTSSNTTSYNNLYSGSGSVPSVGDLFSNPVGIWPSYSSSGYPST